MRLLVSSHCLPIGAGSFVPGIDDLVYGNPEHKVMGVAEQMKLGQQAVADLAAFKKAYGKMTVRPVQL